MSDLPTKSKATVTGPDKDGLMTTSGNEIDQLSPDEALKNYIRSLHQKALNGEELTTDEHDDLAKHHARHSIIVDEKDAKPETDYSPMGD